MQGTKMYVCTETQEANSDIALTKREKIDLKFMLRMSARCDEIDTYLASFINVGDRMTIPRLNGDKDALKLILVNLLKNAA